MLYFDCFYKVILDVFFYKDLIELFIKKQIEKIKEQKLYLNWLLRIRY